MAPATYRSGKLNPLLVSIPPEIREIDFCDCLASDLGRVTGGVVVRRDAGEVGATQDPTRGNRKSHARILGGGSGFNSPER